MRLVAHDREILEAVIEDRVGPAADRQCRQRQRLTRELQPRLLQMVDVEVAVASRPDELAHVEVALLRHHVRQQRIDAMLNGTPRKMSALRW